jgi:hypothetical protein
MVKINFESLRVFKDIEHKVAEVINIKMSVANTLYEHGQGIAFHALALKIYNSEGEMEYTDDEYDLIMAYANQMCKPCIIDALISCKPQEEKKEE